MNTPEDKTTDAMGEFYNSLVLLVDNTKLTPPEVAMAIRMMLNDIETAFTLSVRGK